jgi:hypothetical protein
VIPDLANCKTCRQEYKEVRERRLQKEELLKDLRELK